MLPSPWLGSIGPNFGLFTDPPIINRGGPPRLAICPWGEFNGFLTSFYTFPENKSAIIVMANCSPGQGDPTGLVAQAMAQQLFQMHLHVDLQCYALQAAEAARLRWPALVERWVSQRVQNTRPWVLEEYLRSYYCADLKLIINVSKVSDVPVPDEPTSELLWFNVNRLPRQSAKLRHYHYDTWTFIPNSRNDALRKGMEGFVNLPLLLLEFVGGSDGSISGLKWDLQGGSCEGPAPSLDQRVGPVFFPKIWRIHRGYAMYRKVIRLRHLIQLPCNPEGHVIRISYH